MDAALFAETLRFGMAGLALYAFAEKFLPFIPSFAFLMFVGMTAGGQPADVGLSFLAVTMGSMLGTVALFSLGRYINEQRIRSFAARFGGYLFLSVEGFDRLVAAYRRRQFRVTLIAQFIPVARNYTALSAGTVGIAFVPFFLATIPGTFLWNTLFLTLGYVWRITG